MQFLIVRKPIPHGLPVLSDLAEGRTRLWRVRRARPRRLPIRMEGGGGNCRREGGWYTAAMGEQISEESVRAEVQRFWCILSGMSSGKLEDFYLPTARVFTGKARQSESGKFIAVKRMRHAGGTDFESSFELDPIEVQIAAPDVAIATYTYRFHSSRKDMAGGREQRDTLYGRSTQIFQRDDRGALKIAHEHLSSAAPPKVEKESAKKF